MSLEKPLGRIIYSFNPSMHFLTGIAKPAGPRSILLSFWYLQGTQKAGDKWLYWKDEAEMERRGKLLRAWYEFSEDYDLFIDSGVHTFKAMAHVTKSPIHKMLPIDRAAITPGKQIEDNIEIFTEKYLDYLEANYDYFDWCFEMDCDEFVSVEMADRLYDRMVERIGPDKIIRIWHSVSRPFEEWKKWCEDPNIKYLSVEGGNVHSRNPQFYNKFVNYAHKHGKKVHALALTVKNFLDRVNIDSSDSSTFVNGGRFASCKIPGLGDVIFSTQTFDKYNEEEDEMARGKIATAAMRMHYSRLSPQQLKVCTNWFEKNGYTLEDVLSTATEGSQIRSILNIKYFDQEVDVPYTKGFQKRTIV